MNYKLAIFDMDGTILYTLDDLRDSLNYTLKTFGYNQRSRDEVRSFIGDGIAKLVERGLGQNCTPAILDNALGVFLNHYKEHCADTTKPYDGILDTLKELKSRGTLLAVVSNKAHHAVQALCEQFFEGLFDCSIGESTGIAKKPAPDMVNKVLLSLGVDKKEAIYIGDADTDIMTARNTGIDCVSVSWGYKDVDYLQNCGATKIVYTPNELLGVL